jgi:hypothetical protein
MARNKGGKYERAVCKQLSVWWTGGKRDDVFWRTAGSGGRATQRNRRGQRTFGQYGDVQATDPIGQPLLDVFTIEIKRGHPTATLTDVLHTQHTKTRPKLLNWIDKAERDCRNSGSMSWAIISKCDAKHALITIPLDVQFVRRATRFANYAVYHAHKGPHFIQMRFDMWMHYVLPHVVKDVAAGVPDE